MPQVGYLQRLTVSNFSFFITTDNVFVFVDSNSSITDNTQNYAQIHVTMFFSH
jgi:hypothetical protein